MKKNDRLKAESRAGIPVRKQDSRSSSSPAESASRSRNGMVYGLSGGVLWALDSVILAVGLAPFDMIWLAPVCATMIHDSISAMILLVIDLFQKKTDHLFSVFRYQESRWLILAGILGGPVGMSGYVFSISCLGPGLSAVMSCLYPAFGLILAFFFFHERFTVRQIGGLILSLAGVAVLSMSSSAAFGSSLILGIGCGLVCALGWALEGLAAQKGTASGKISSQQALTIRQSVSSLTFMLILLPLTHSWPTAIEMIQSASLWKIAAAAIAGTLRQLSLLLSGHPADRRSQGNASEYYLLCLGDRIFFPDFRRFAFMDRNHLRNGHSSRRNSVL